jgi:hypothetical protein
MSKVVKQVERSVKDVLDVTTAPAKAVVDVITPDTPDTPDVGKVIREQEARAERKAAEQQAEIGKMEEEERRKRQSSLRAALEPRAGMFDLLGSSQRDTLG